jgi:rhodanese-related sulfurtransferase
MINFLKSLLSKDNSSIKEALAKGAVIIDVRTHDEFRTGHIPGSQNIPLAEIKQRIQFIRNWNKPVIMVCLSGGRSAAATSLLAAAGIEAYNGGSWQQLKAIKS